MRSIIKLAVAAAILSIGSTQAFADSNFDSGKLDECGSLTNFYNNTLSGQIPDEAGFKSVLDATINMQANQIQCEILTSTGYDAWVKYYRLKVNTVDRHFHFRIKPWVGATTKIDGSW